MSKLYVQSPNDIPNLYPPIFDPAQTQEIQDYLAAEGFVAIQVTSAKVAQERYAEFWTWLENLDSGIDRHDSSTWDKKTTWPQQDHGIIFGYGVGQSEFAWKSRIDHNVMKVFSDLWQVPETKLVTSFDGANMYPNPEYAHNGTGEGEDQDMNEEIISSPHGAEVYVKVAKADQAPISSTPKQDKLGLVHKAGQYRMWPHRDQAPSKQGRICVQGLYNMLPNTSPNDGGLVVYPRTHTIDWTERYPAASSAGDWYVINPDERAPEIKTENAAVLRTPAGCLILWDSRTIHCNRPPTTGGRTRAVSYICMLPKGNTTKSVLAQRQKLYEAFRTTSHWPFPVVVNDESSSSNNVKPDVIMKKLQKTKPFGINHLTVRSLVGFTDEPLWWQKKLTTEHHIKLPIQAIQATPDR